MIKARFNCDIVETPKDKPSKCDGFLVKKNTVVGLFEDKCRYTTYEQFKRWKSWIITYEKLDKCVWLSNLLCVPFYGFLYIVHSDKILYWKITDDEGNYLFEPIIKKTKTQATINGGEAERENAFLPLECAKILYE